MTIFFDLRPPELSEGTAGNFGQNPGFNNFFSKSRNKFSKCSTGMFWVSGRCVGTSSLCQYKNQGHMYNVREAHGQNLIMLKSPLIKPTVRHPCTWMSWSITNQLGWSRLLSKVSFLSNASNLLQFHCARKKDFLWKNRLCNPEKAFVKHF